MFGATVFSKMNVAARKYAFCDAKYVYHMKRVYHMSDRDY